MSARLSDSHALASDAVQDFGSLSFEVIHTLSARVKELEAELEERDKEAALLIAELEKQRGRR